MLDGPALGGQEAGATSADAQQALSIYLAGLLYEAMRDLYHLNAHDGPSPRHLFDRFVAWGPYRRPIVEPPT
ncbi:hypothetical protein OG777_22635 [Micromonospora peucetia]|nr:hypothetical protein [Micromonospora peucetia]MCX4389707.1 hypothetical protein [Micromonospora peucetia]